MTSLGGLSSLPLLSLWLFTKVPLLDFVSCKQIHHQLWAGKGLYFFVMNIVPMQFHRQNINIKSIIGWYEIRVCSLRYYKRIMTPQMCCVASLEIGKQTKKLYKPD